MIDADHHSLHTTTPVATCYAKLLMTHSAHYPPLTSLSSHASHSSHSSYSTHSTHSSHSPTAVKVERRYFEVAPATKAEL